MLWMNRFDKHADLVGRMAETLGVDLGEQMMRGALPPTEMRSAVMACMGCKEAGDCVTLARRSCGGVGRGAVLLPQQGAPAGACGALMAEDLDALLGVPVAERHFWLTQGMARTVGVNLTEAIAAGRMTRDDLAHMVVRCAGCEFPERCVRWMADGRHLGEDPPAYCLNHEAIEAIRARV
jgi:hypothetical protein